MRLLSLVCSMFLLHSGLALAVNNEPVTRSTLPATLGDMQLFMRDEDAARCREQGLGNFIVSGGTHGTSGTLTSPAFATVAYTNWCKRVNQPAQSINYGAVGCGGTDTAYVIASARSENTLDNFVRVTGTDYFVDCTSSAEPPLPNDSVWLGTTTLSGSTITGGSDFISQTPLGCARASQFQGATIAHQVQAAHDALPGSGCIDASNMSGNRSWPVPVILTKPVTIYFGAGTMAYTGAGCAFDVQSDDVAFVGLGRAATTFLISGTAGTEKGYCSTGAVRLFWPRLDRVRFDGVDTVGSVGLDLTDVADEAIFRDLDVRDFATGIEFCSPAGGTRGVLEHVDVRSNTTGISFPAACGTTDANSTQIRGGRVFQNVTGIDLDAGNNIKIENVMFESNTGWALQLGGNGNVVSGNRFEANSGALGSIQVTGDRNTFLGNHYASGVTDRVENTGNFNLFLDRPATGSGIYPPSGIGVTNLLCNGGFEFDSSSAQGQPDCWAQSFTTNNTETFSLETGTARTGQRALRIVNVNSVNPRLTQTRTLSVQQDYILVWRAMCSVGTNVCQIRVGTSGAGSAEIDTENIPGDSIWRWHYIRFTPGNAVVTVSIYLSTSTAAQIDIDDMGLYAGTLAPAFENPLCHTYRTQLFNAANTLAAATSDSTFTLTGALAGKHQISVSPTSALESGIVLSGAWVSADNTVTVRVGNLTAAPINPAQQDLWYTICGRD